MKLHARLSFALVAGLALVGAANAQLYTNKWDGSANSYSSQNDTTGGNGNFATVYSWFTTAGAQWNVKDIHFVGSFFNPIQHGNIAGFTIKFWSEGAGHSVGAQQGATQFVSAGNFTETLIGNVSGFDMYQYDMNLTGTLVSGASFVSIVPDLGFPPQWGLAQGADVDPAHSSIQDFFGSPSDLGVSTNFVLTGDVVPEPATLTMLAVGALAMVRRRKASK